MKKRLSEFKYENYNMEEQVALVESHIEELKSEIKRLLTYLVFLKSKKDIEPYCYANRFYKFVFPDGRKMIFKTLGVIGKGVRIGIERKVCGEDGYLMSGEEYKKHIGLDMIRHSTEVSESEYNEFIEFTYRTGW